MVLNYVIEKFALFQKKVGEKKSYLKINEFLNSFKKDYLDMKTCEFIQKGFDQNEAHNKARQSWRPKVGASLEKLIEYMINQYCKNNQIKITSDKELKKTKLISELDLVRRMLEIHFDTYSILPDADLILYKYQKDKVKILAILSLKTSFRERFTETPYWKLKLKENAVTKKIKVFMITPDNTGEISYSKTNKPRKARIILEYELDGIYLAKESFDSSPKIKSISKLFEDLEVIKNEDE